MWKYLGVKGHDACVILQKRNKKGGGGEYGGINSEEVGEIAIFKKDTHRG